MRFTFVFRSVALALSLLVLSACSGSVSVSFGGKTDIGEFAEELADGELAEGLGLGNLATDCPELTEDDVAPGATFSCVGMLDDGRQINFLVTRDLQEDSLNVVTTNVIRAEVVTVIRNTSVDLMNAQNDFPDPIDPESVDCPDQEVLILDGTTDVVCGIGLAGDIYDWTVTLSPDLLTVTNVRIGDTPRP